MSRNIFNDSLETDINERTINFQNLNITSSSVPILGTNNVVSSTPITSTGLDLLGVVSIADLRAQILENTDEEAIRLTDDATGELNFFIGGTTISNLKLQITELNTYVNNTLSTKEIQVDNANKLVCNNIAYRDDNTNPVYMNFDGDHCHFLSPDGIRINQQFQIDSDNGSNPTHIRTTAANKDIQLSCHGTGKIQTLSTLETQADILPNITSQRNIGSSTLKYNNVFADILNTDNIKASTLLINDGTQNSFRLTSTNKSYIQSQYGEIVFSAYISTDAVLSILSGTTKKVITHYPLETDFIRPIATQTRDIGTSLLEYRDIYTQNTRNSNSLYTNTLRPNSGSYIDVTGADFRVDTGHQLQTKFINTQDGDLSLRATGSNIVIQSGKNLQVNNTITTGSGNLTLNPAGLYVMIPSDKVLTATTISSPTLDLTLTAAGSNVKILQGKTFRVSNIGTETGDITIDPIGNNVIIGGSKNLQTSTITSTGDLTINPTGSNVIINSGKNLQTSTITSTSDLTINPTGSNVIINSSKNLQVSNITTSTGNLILNPAGTHIEINSGKILKTNEITTHSTQDLKLSPNSNKVILEGLTSLIAEPISTGPPFNLTYIPEIGSDDKAFGQSFISTQNCKRTKFKDVLDTSSSTESCIQQLSDVLQIGYNNETALGSVQVTNSSLGTSRVDLKANEIDFLVAESGSVNTAPVSQVNITSSGILCGNISAADLTATNITYATSLQQSDFRLKQDIHKIDVGINEICELNPVKFKYKTDIEREHYGFIAQEVEKAFPKNLVIPNKKTGMLGINMINLIAPMVSSIQSLKQEVDDLKETNKQLIILLEKLINK